MLFIHEVMLFQITPDQHVAHPVRLSHRRLGDAWLFDLVQRVWRGPLALQRPPGAVLAAEDAALMPLPSAPGLVLMYGGRAWGEWAGHVCISVRQLHAIVNATMSMIGLAKQRYAEP